MFRAMRIVLAATTVGCLTTWAGEAPAEKPTAKRVRERFYRCWLELERVEAGKRTTDPHRLNGVQYTETRYWSWGRRGELAKGPGEPGVTIDPTTDPMRVEFHGTGGPVLPGIFKFDGDKLVLVTGGWTKAREWAAGEDYPQRPREFKATNENGWTMSVYKPCAEYDQD